MDEIQEILVKKISEEIDEYILSHAQDDIKRYDGGIQYTPYCTFPIMNQDKLDPNAGLPINITYRK